MRKYFLLTILLLSATIPSLAQPTVWDWSVNYGGFSGGSTNIDMVRDPQGNHYVVGEFSGTRSFGSFVLTTAGQPEVFVAKFNATGTCLWVTQAGGATSYTKAGGIAYDNGNVYFTGTFSNTFTVMGTTVTSTGGTDVYIAALSALSGSTVWARKAGGVEDDNGIAICSLGSGGFMITGDYYGSATFGSQSVNAGSNFNIDIYLAAYDQNGSCIWVVGAGNYFTDDRGIGVKQLPNGTIGLTGYFQGSATFGSTTVTGALGPDIFVANYNLAGTLNWIQTAVGDGSEQGLGITCDSTNNVFITGVNADTVMFGTTLIGGDGYGNIFVAKYDGQGVFQWAKKASSNTLDAGFKIAADAIGSTYVSGVIGGTANFSGTFVTGVQGFDGFIAKYNPSGGIVWVTKISTSGNDNAKGVIPDMFGFCHVVGEYGDALTLGSTTHPAQAGAATMFLARLGGGTVGINEPGQGIFINAFPVPATDQLNVTFTGLNDFIITYELFSVDGRIVSGAAIDVNSANGTHAININTLPAGTYFLNVHTSSGDYTRTVVKQ